MAIVTSVVALVVLQNVLGLQGIAIENGSYSASSTSSSNNISSSTNNTVASDFNDLQSAENVTSDPQVNNTHPAIITSTRATSDTENSTSRSRNTDKNQPKETQTLETSPTTLKDSCLEVSSQNLSTKSNQTRDQTTQAEQVKQDDVTEDPQRMPHSPTTMSSTTSARPSSSGPEAIAAIRKLMELAGLVPLAMIGIVLNCLSLWVWQADRAYNTTTFLFKYLALWDSLCLLTLIFFVSKLNALMNKVVLPISNVAQRVSVHTTLLVSITRWLAVTRPLHVKSLLPAGRVRIVCVVLLFWCILIESLFFYSSYAKLDWETAWTVYYVQRVVGLALPLVLMLIFNILLVLKTRQSRQEAGITNHQQGMEARYRLTQATVCISVCSLIAYPVSIITETATNIRCYDGSVYVCDRFTIYCIKFVTFILQVLNLGINFVFYVAFASRFRQLLLARMRCGCSKRKDASSAAVEESRAAAYTVENAVKDRPQ